MVLVPSTGSSCEALDCDGRNPCLVGRLPVIGLCSAKPVTTEDIDVLLDPANQRLDSASFIPGVTWDTVEEKARESATLRSAW